MDSPAYQRNIILLSLPELIAVERVRVTHEKLEAALKSALENCEVAPTEFWQEYKASAWETLHEVLARLCAERRVVDDS